jgi:predicted exporter
MKAFMTRLDSHCSAPPEVVYDMLADLRSHLEWGGAEQRRDFRLLSLDAPEGPATAGTSFTSTGAIPMSLRKWSDRSTVTIAERPCTFEFVTQATARRPRRSMEATYRHRYEITAAPGGSKVIYTFTQLEASHPFLRMALPVVRAITWRVGIPFLAGRGFRRLLATAERRTTLEGVSVATSSIAGHGSFQTAK